jgi:DNA-binding beta-propeller fold protein YncE
MSAAVRGNGSIPVLDTALRVISIESKYNLGVSIVRRSQVNGKTPPDAIVHDAITEVYQIIEGRGVLVTGGTIESAARLPEDDPDVRRLIGPSSIGKLILGGTRQAVAPGDVVVIPPHTPHGFVEINTKRIVYTLVRIDPQRVLELRDQTRGAQPAPSNDAPNPFRTVEGWAKLPDGRAWGSTSAVDIDKDGVSIWVAERCGQNSCATSKLDPILKFDANGKLVKSFGAGMLLSPHGIHVDRDGNVWVTDCACTGGSAAAVTARIGHQVFKFSPDGELLLTLGKAGGGKGEEFFWQPNDVLVAPNGEIYVAEGHASSDSANARILKFDKTGRLIATFGKKGRGVGEFDQPHALAMDSRGRIFVGDRNNNRIVIIDQNGRWLDVWQQFSRPSGIYIDRNDVIYVADSESGSVDPAHKEWKRGIRIGSAKSGKVTAFIPDPIDRATDTSAAEGVAVDSRGNIYGAEVGPRALKRYVPAPGTR